MERNYPELYDADWLQANIHRTLGDLAKDLGCCIATVWQAYRLAGLLPMRRSVTRQRARVVVRMRRMGMTFEEIAREFGVTRQAANQMFHMWDPRIPRDEEGTT